MKLKHIEILSYGNEIFLIYGSISHGMRARLMSTLEYVIIYPRIFSQDKYFIFLQNTAKIHNIICIHTRYGTSVLIVIMLLAELIFLPVSSGSLIIITLQSQIRFLPNQIHRWRSRNIVPNRGMGTTDTLDGRTQ